MPAYGNFILDKGYDAAAALMKFRGVKLVPGTPEAVTPVVASTDIMHGVSQFDVSTAEIGRGKGASVRIAGITEIEIGAPVARDQELMLDNQGRAIPSAAGAGNRVVGRALEAGAALGNRVPMLIYTPARVL